MAKKGTLNWWKKKAWTEFSKFIRIRDALRTTGTIDKLVCCSCGKFYPAFGKGCAQAGHFIPGRGNSILFEETCVHGQCYHCNSSELNGLKGNWPGYYAFMLKTYGQEEIDRLLALRHKIRKFTPGELETMRNDYKDKYEWLKRPLGGHKKPEEMRRTIGELK